MNASTYFISPLTLAILPAKQIGYDSIIVKHNQTLHIEETPLGIIKASCYKHWTTYDGRRRAVMHHMNYTHKVPVPISITRQLYFFPTHSPTSSHNCWIAAHHIAFITKITKRKSTIQFKCGQTVTLDISSYILQQQKNRTYACMYKLEKMKIGGIGASV